MNIPKLHVSLINKTMKETLGVLQGISRYIEGIHIERTLIDHEGEEIIAFLKKRYPTKKMFLSLNDEKVFTSKVASLVRKANLKYLIISNELPKAELEKFLALAKTLQKTVVLSGISFLVDDLKKNNVKHLYFLKSQAKFKTESWKPKITKEIEKLLMLNYSIMVGSTNAHNIMQFQNIRVHTFVVREEICHSFNPIATCKDITNQLKNYFLDVEES